MASGPGRMAGLPVGGGGRESAGLLTLEVETSKGLAIRSRGDMRPAPTQAGGVSQAWETG